MKKNQQKVKAEWLSSDDLHYAKGTTRQWLRDKWKDGKVRRRVITGVGHNGEVREKYLFNTEDVERELRKTES